MDRKLVASEQQYEVSYFAKKHRISAADARSILQSAGRSREKANELAKLERGATAGETIQDGGRSSGHGREPSAHKPAPAGANISSGHGRPGSFRKPSP